MAGSIASLIVRIGAQDQEIQKALASIGQKAKSVDADLKKLGNSPLAGGAQKSLDTLTATMKTVTDAQQRLADRATLAARGIETMGGASRLTDTQLKQVNKTLQDGISAYRALGQEPPAALKRISEELKNTTGNTEKCIASAKALGIAFGSAAILRIGRDLLRMGDEIERVADRTGLFTDEVQKLSYISMQSGNSIDELTGAIGQMQNRLSSGDKSAVGAVRELGISFQELKAAGPFQQLELIAAAVAKIPDPADRARIAMDLFGRTGIAILPTLTAEFKRLGDQAPLMSDATVKALADADDAIKLFSLTIRVTLAESYNFAGKMFDGLTAFGMRFRAAFAESTASLLEMAAKIPGATKVVPQLGEAIAGLRAHAVLSRDAAMLLTTSIEDGTDKTRKAIPVVADYDAIVGKTGGSLSKAATEQDRWNEKVAAASGTLMGTFVGDLEMMHFQLRQIEVIQSRVFGPQARSPLGILPTTGSRRIGSGLGTEPNIPTPNIQVAGIFSGLKDGLSGVLDDLNGIFQKAFEGGGGVAGAVKSLATKAVAAFTSMIPVIGPAVSKFAGAIVAGFSKIFGKSEETLNVSPLRDAFFKAAGGLDVLNPKVLELTGNLELVEAIFKAKTVDEFTEAMGRLDAAFDVQKQATNDLNAAIQKYGFSIEELGPKFAQQQLTAQTGDLLKEYKLLLAAGIEHDTILRKTSTSFQALVTNALKSSTVISDELQGPIQSLIDMGLLVDENGNKLVDLGSLKFGKLDSEFSTLTKAINNLTKALGGAIDEADELAKDRDFTIKGTVEIGGDVYPDNFGGPDDFPAGSRGFLPVWEGSDIPAGANFARGGMVPGPMGAPMNALVHGGELVLNPQQQRSLGGSMQVVVNFNGPVLAEADYIEKHVTPNVIEGIERNYLRRFSRTVQMAGAT